ncbi:hypothetical protein HELRODRAFT_176656 [Helobdella robusta]|uniref:Uncharacterized protein n=1 Tax=Helobdella robusta TaxID=6412 RepID=T1FAR8_HELRO|nr:hypothetical protein HELRODRAFT_176656 [Helobdella robusta]ESN99495.1 hypothetical protein HELRODRAFT_176656 [Helobdella robusta]
MPKDKKTNKRFLNKPYSKKALPDNTTATSEPAKSSERIYRRRNAVANLLDDPQVAANLSSVVLVHNLSELDCKEADTETKLKKLENSDKESLETFPSAKKEDTKDNT